MSIIKTIVITAVCFNLLASAGPSVSGSILREFALCETADGNYTIGISGHQGRMPDPMLKMNATVRENRTHTLVAAYVVHQLRSMRSVSFGRRKYQDLETEGKNFSLQGPSTNFRHYSVDVVTNVSTESPRQIRDDNLSCTVFNGEVLLRK